MAETIQRQVAHRVFANEFNQSRAVIEGEGEKDPNFVVTPLGAKVNRLHVVGVCTEVEPVGESGEVWRARVSDPTGVFTVYAGQYQPEAAQALSDLETPAFIAVTGKARTYEPEPGSLFVSIRPETITKVEGATRDQWILDTARRTKERIVAVTGDTPQGALAREHYGVVDPTRFKDALLDTVKCILPGGEVPVHTIQREEREESAAPQWTPPAQTETESAPSDEEDALDDAILKAVQELEGDDGAAWDAVVDKTTGDTVTPDAVEESLNRLMDKGLIYEPTLGVLKST